jgi:hypothetical protein
VGSFQVNAGSLVVVVHGCFFFVWIERIVVVYKLVKVFIFGKRCFFDGWAGLQFTCTLKPVENALALGRGEDNRLLVAGFFAELWVTHRPA